MSKDKSLDFLVETLLQIKTDNEMQEFLKGIFTPQELDEIPTRLQIVKKLKQGIPQHQIAKELNVGVATVTRGSKEIQKGRFKNI
jgi:TrpR family trp operon transcriptional repressor